MIRIEINQECLAGENFIFIGFENKKRNTVFIVDAFIKGGLLIMGMKDDKGMVYDSHMKHIGVDGIKTGEQLRQLVHEIFPPVKSQHTIIITGGEEGDEEYDLSESKYKKLIYMSNGSFNLENYILLIKIAAFEYARFLTSFHKQNITIEKNSSGINKGDAFVIASKKGFKPNNRFINKCISNARKGEGAIVFEFCKTNIVLDKLENSIKRRG